MTKKEVLLTTVALREGIRKTRTAVRLSKATKIPTSTLISRLESGLSNPKYLKVKPFSVETLKSVFETYMNLPSGGRSNYLRRPGFNRVSRKQKESMRKLRLKRILSDISWILFYALVAALSLRVYEQILRPLLGRM